MSEYDLGLRDTVEAEERAARSASYTPSWAVPLAPARPRATPAVVEAPPGDEPETFIWTPWGPMPRQALPVPVSEDP